MLLALVASPETVGTQHLQLSEQYEEWQTLHETL